jgi:hypothetical protein
MKNQLPRGTVISEAQIPLAIRPPMINERSAGASYVKFIDCAAFTA